MLTQRHPAPPPKQDFSLTADEILASGRCLLAQEVAAITHVTECLAEPFVRAVEMMLDCEGHVWVTGAGTSRGVAERLAHVLTCSGLPAAFVHPGDSLHGFAATLTRRDLLLAISRGGDTEEILHLARVAREREIPMIGLTEAAHSPLADLSTLVLYISPHPSLEAEGFIPLSSSLASAALGDALCAVVRLDRGYSPEEFRQLHPGGAVGKLLEDEA